MTTLDPLATSVDRALKAGWILVPQIKGNASDNALVLFGNPYTYLVTLPLVGDSTVACFHGGPPPGRPREPVHEPWRHRVPADVALTWVLSNPRDDRALREWMGRQGRRR